MDDPLSIFTEIHANSFLRAYDRCMYPLDQGLGTPALICAALSAELGMKTILSKYGIGFGREHDLSKLLKLLPVAERDAIIAETSRSFSDFDAQLAKAAKAFVEWRYIYESKEPKELNIMFVGALAAAVNQRFSVVRTAT
jgi:hypothetical protein